MLPEVAGLCLSARRSTALSGRNVAQSPPATRKNVAANRAMIMGGLARILSARRRRAMSRNGSPLHCTPLDFGPRTSDRRLSDMCGRFTLRTPPKDLIEVFQLLHTLEMMPRYNIAPTQPVAVVRQGATCREMSLL